MKNKKIAVIGGANIEYIVKSKEDIIKGSKNYVDIEELYGGGGLNFALRLMSAGFFVYPLLYIGHDNIGHNIQMFISAHSTLDDEMRKFITRDEFFVDGLHTIRSVIVVEGLYRTILAQDGNKKNLFLPFLKSQVSRVDDVSSVIIGHLHNDHADINRDISELSTSYSIEYFNSLGKFIYCNFGSTQISYGFYFWKNYLKQIDILQLNIDEARLFFTHDSKVPTLYEIISLLGKYGNSGIITLDKFGAIGFMKDRVNTVFMARPVDLGDEFVDSTGAGDAFCAGMVSVLNGNREFSQKEFKSAMEIARSWAVYACKSYGGANNCPTKGTIDAFHQKINFKNEVVEYSGDRMIDILSLIDSTFKLP
jgi:sugar/nucleoside kinase (ribokinase family)